MLFSLILVSRDSGDATAGLGQTCFCSVLEQRPQLCAVEPQPPNCAAGPPFSISPTQLLLSDWS